MSASTPNRLLVCGGRDFADAELLSTALDAVHGECPLTHLIHGAARGADSLAARWATERGIRVLSFPARWKTYGNAAGPLRNQAMLESGRPDAVIAFPGGRGTEDMINRAVRAGVPTFRATRDLSGWRLIPVNPGASPPVNPDDPERT